MNGTLQPFCTGCQRPADQIAEYVEIAALEGTTPDAEARRDGTYNRANGHLLCTTCYMLAGMPSTPYGWVAP